MTKVRRAGYVFVTWVGDHAPRHVHVFKDGRMVLKWDLDSRGPIAGRASRKILRLIARLESEGLL